MRPSGEEAYKKAYERDLHRGILHKIVERYPSANKGDKYSAEIIEMALSIMIVEKEAKAKINPSG